MDRDEIILRIIESAQSIIDNAESIVGTEKLLQKLTITIDVADMDNMPVINIHKDVMPEKFVERFTNN